MNKKWDFSVTLFLWMGIVSVFLLINSPLWAGDGMRTSVRKASKSICAQVPKGTEVLVADFKNVDNEDIGLGRVLADQLRISLVREGLAVLDGGDIDLLPSKKIDSQELTPSAQMKDQPSPKTKPPLFIRGTIVELERTLQWNVELIEVEKGQIVGGFIQEMDRVKLFKDLNRLEVSDDRKKITQIKSEAEKMEAAVQYRIKTSKENVAKKDNSQTDATPTQISSDFHKEMQKKIDRQFNALLPSGGSGRRKVYEVDKSAPSFANSPNGEDVADAESDESDEHE